MGRRARSAASGAHEARLSGQQLEKEVLEARLRLMEAQIEPHFLFNTLANLQRLFETQPESASRLLDNLKVYLRAALPQMRQSSSTLEREADFARAYLEVLQARMGSRLAFSIEVPAHLSRQPFPPMMLVTLVENSVKHGLDPSASGGRIRIGAHERGPHLVVEVTDTGVGLPRGSTGSGVGLSNIRARLSAVFAEAAELSLRENEPTGVVAAILVPMSASPA
jgi:LytS/YehU family sensor histidine kinase